MSKKLDVKIGTKEEAAWKLIKDQAEKELEQGKREQIINSTILKLAEAKIAEEQKI